MENVAVGMGSNMGNRIENLSKGISLLHSNPKINIIKSSSIYRSDAKDFVGDYFFNTVIILKTTLTPLQLLSTFKQIETKFGKKIRNRDDKIESRLLDLDIIFYGDKNIKTSKLTIPHPEFHNRLFVLKPILELLPTTIFLKNCDNWEKNFNLCVQKAEEKDSIKLLNEESESYFNSINSFFN